MTLPLPRYKPYVKKLVKNYDMKAQATDSGMAIRPLTAAEVLKHLDDFGIDSQLAHGKIRQMVAASASASSSAPSGRCRT